MTQPIEPKKLIYLGVIALVLGVINNILFFDQGIGLNFPLFVIAVLLGGWILVKKPFKQAQKSTLILVALVVFFSIMVFVRASELLTFFNVVGCILLMLILIETHIGKKLKDYFPGDYLKIFLVPFWFIPSFFSTISEFFSLKKVGSVSSRMMEIIRGTVIAIVALVIFGWLFASADLVFQRFFSELFEFSISPEFVTRLVLFCVVSAALIAAFGYMFTRMGRKSADETTTSQKALGVIETNIPLVAINILFLAFIILQITHLFGGNAHLVSEGITYAEYARRGFFELLFVAILSFLLISVVEKRIVRRENSHIKSFRILSLLLIAQTIIILVSAFFRLSLYEHAYGFSTIRLYSHALMVWVGLVLIFLAYHIYAHGTRAKFGFQLFCSVIALLLFMNLLNPDVFIAKQNLERYKETGKIDADYLASLSYDAIPYTVSLFKDSDEAVRYEYAHGLYESLLFSDFDGSYWPIENRDWRSSQLSKTHARNILKPYMNTIKKAEKYVAVPTYTRSRDQGVVSTPNLSFSTVLKNSCTSSASTYPYIVEAVSAKPFAVKFKDNIKDDYYPYATASSERNLPFQISSDGKKAAFEIGNIKTIDGECAPVDGTCSSNIYVSTIEQGKEKVPFLAYSKDEHAGNFNHSVGTWLYDSNAEMLYIQDFYTTAKKLTGRGKLYETIKKVSATTGNVVYEKERMLYEDMVYTHQPFNSELFLLENGNLGQIESKLKTATYDDVEYALPYKDLAYREIDSATGDIVRRIKLPVDFSGEAAGFSISESGKYVALYNGWLGKNGLYVINLETQQVQLHEPNIADAIKNLTIQWGDQKTVELSLKTGKTLTNVETGERGSCEPS